MWRKRETRMDNSNDDAVAIEGEQTVDVADQLVKQEGTEGIRSS